MSKEFLERMSVPVVLGAMSMGGTGAEIVSAVANEGGAGTISGSGFPWLMSENGLSFDEANKEGLRRQIRKAHQLTKGPVLVNVLRVVRNFFELAKVAFEEGIDAFVCGAAFDRELPKMARNYPNTALVPVVSSKKMVEKYCREWGESDLPYAVIVEGPKAGGHLGYNRIGLEKETRQLAVTVRQTRDFLKSQGYDIRVIAGGGIRNRQDAAFFLSNEVGADAVQLSTKFITTKECSFGEGFKEIHKEAAERGTVIIDSPVGLIGRAVRNKFTEKILSGNPIEGGKCHHCIANCKFENERKTFCILYALWVAKVGNKDQVEKHGLVFGGEYSGESTEIVTVKDVMDEFRGLPNRYFLQP